MVTHRVIALLWCVVVVLLATTRPAYAWIENQVLGVEARVEVEQSGKAVIEQRITLKTNGNVRLRRYRIRGVDRDAVPLPNSYVVPARDALSGSLDSATPVSMELHHPRRRDPDDAAPPAELEIKVDDRKGLRRGKYLFVLRYRTDLRARGLIQRDGAMVRIRWDGPSFDDGFDNARTIFVLPAAPTAPRAVEQPTGAEDEDTLPSTYLSEVRRGSEQDEVELMRTYAPKEASIPWSVRVDPRALAPLPRPSEPATTASRPDDDSAVAKIDRDIMLAIGGALFLFYLLLVWLKGREVARLARQSGATMPPLVPLPAILRGLLAALLLTGGVALQLLAEQAAAGASCVVAACVMAAHGGARVAPDSQMRGPGRWLTVSESEALASVPALHGAVLDVSTRLGKLLLLLLLVTLSAAVYFLAQLSAFHALLVGFDGVALLAVFGTGLMRSLPPDMAVEPARFLRKVVHRLRKRKGMKDVRIAARIRIPRDAVDPDELRLLVVPRLPLRGFSAIEVGVIYALGIGARVAMPEVLLRVVAGSPCDDAVAVLSARGRITPGRRREERVIAFAPRFPTVRSIAEITAALAVRVKDGAPARTSERRSKPDRATRHKAAADRAA